MTASPAPGADRPRVALLPNIVGYGVTSMDRYADELLRALQARGSDQRITALSIRRSPWLGERWSARHARFVRYPWRLLQTRADIYHVLDHSHAHLLRLLPPARSVLTFHDCIPHRAALGLLPLPAVPAHERRASLRRLRLAARCARVITDSAATRDDLLAFGGLDPARVVVVPLGVSAVFSADPPAGTTRDAERSHWRARLGLADDALLLLQVGSRDYKNVPGALAIVRQLCDDAALRARVHLLRIGIDRDDRHARLAERLGIGRQVMRIDAVAGDAAFARLYRAADLLVFPSLWEGFGWPPLEAMACATPVVASNAGALPEVIGDVVETAAPDDHERLAQIARRLLLDPAARAAAIAGGLRRVAAYDWASHAAGVQRVYAQLD